MSGPLLLPLFAGEGLFRALAEGLGAEAGVIERRRFPDGESYVRIESECRDRDVSFVCGLDRPDAKTLPLLFAAQTARELGARRISLIAPYFPYMRQDRRFHAGESVSARNFGELIARYFDALVTVDPHLHRIGDLRSVCPTDCTVVPAAPAIAAWISRHVDHPLLIGPDGESEQWVAAVAERAGAPWTTGGKTRHGDREVAVDLPGVRAADDRVPVLIDDIISTGHTMAAAARRLVAGGSPPPVCIAVHAVFDDEAMAVLGDAGVREIVTCNTIEHRSNGIDLAPSIVAAIGRPR